jgi:hypothetical protein
MAKRCLWTRESDNKYRRAAAYLAGWLTEGVLVEVQSPAIYVHDHFFTFQVKRRRPPIAAV